MRPVLHYTENNPRGLRTLQLTQVWYDTARKGATI